MKSEKQSLSFSGNDSPSNWKNCTSNENGEMKKIEKEKQKGSCGGFLPKETPFFLQKIIGVIVFKRGYAGGRIRRE
jgi:hypothetical protein